ncbi:MAG: patatin-like phospholipase family protein [Cytophagaceae bacterium]|nr:patatin-like phospholipase family protein [Cytophagaceae bacterium]
MKIGVALSGGGARGVVHLGALAALEEKGIKPTIISGVSSGAIIGALYAYGMKPQEILDTLVKTKIFRYLRPAWSKFGFLNIQKLMAIYKLYLPVQRFEDLPMKLYISAADIREGKTVFFTEGDLVKAILASSCMPVLFAPIEIDNKLMVDGGIINNLPVEPLVGEVDLIIGVHANPTNTQYNISSIKSMIERTFHLAIGMNVRDRVKYCDIFIEPPALCDYSIFEISKAKEIYQIGYEYTLRVIEESKPLLERKGILVP